MALGLDEKTEKELADLLHKTLNRYWGAPLTKDLMETMRGEARAIIGQMEREGMLPPGYLQWEIFPTDDPGGLRLAVARNFALFPMDRVEFVEWVGREPEQDDLERVNCTKVGQPGHFLCGWDLKAGMPRFESGNVETAAAWQLLQDAHRGDGG